MRAVLIILFVVLLIILFLYFFRGIFSSGKSYTEVVFDKFAQAKRFETEAKFTNIIRALDGYFSDNNDYPESLEKLLPYYLRLSSDITDSWGNVIKIKKEGERDLLLISAGPDKLFGSADDIKRRI